MPYGKDGIKQLKKDHADLKKNPPKIEKEGNFFIVKIYSNTVKKYIDVAEYANERIARTDLKHFMKDHKETLAKIMKLSKDVKKESLDESFKKGQEVVVNSKTDDYHLKVGEITKLGRGKSKGVYVVKFPNGQRSSYNEDELEKHIKSKDGDVWSKNKDRSVTFKESLDEEMDNDLDTLSRRSAQLGHNDDAVVYYNDLGYEDQMLRDSKNFAQGAGRNGLGLGFESYMKEGWGADKQKKDMEASNKEWETLKKKYKDNPKLVKKACSYRDKNYKAKPAFAKAMKDLGINEEIKIVAGSGFTRDEKQKIFDTFDSVIKGVKFDFGNNKELKATYKGKTVKISKANGQYISNIGRNTISSSSIAGALLKHPRLTVFEEINPSDILKDTLHEGIKLPSDVAKKLKAKVASGAKGKIIPSVQVLGGKQTETRFYYTDDKGEDHDIITVDRKVDKKETDAIMKYIHKKYSK